MTSSYTRGDPYTSYILMHIASTWLLYTSTHKPIYLRPTLELTGKRNLN